MAQLRIVKTNTSQVTLALTETEIKMESVPIGKLDASFSKTADADFWPLKVRQDADISSCDSGLFAYSSGDGSMVFGRAVTEIEPEYINSGSHQARNHVA